MTSRRGRRLLEILGFLFELFVVMRASMKDDGADKDVFSDFCGFEKFSVRCANDEIILVRNALYGRMQAGRCVTGDYAHAIGCYADVTSYVNGMCSGRQNCSFLVATMDSVAQPCAKDFKSYLEASYRCVKVSFMDECPGNASLTLINQHVGYLALHSRYFGTPASTLEQTCYWRLTVEPGRKIALSWARTPSGNGPGQVTSVDVQGHPAGGRCPVYIQISEPDQPDSTLSACHGYNHLQGIVHSSKGNQLEIHVTFTHELLHTTNDLSFWKGRVLKYAVFGCSDLPSTEGATIWRHADSAAVVCNSTGETWYLTCTDGRWTGDLGNCSKNSPKKLISPATSFTTIDLRNGAMLAVLIGVAVGILIGSLMLFGIVLTRKSYRSAAATTSAAGPPTGNGSSDSLDESVPIGTGSQNIRLFSRYHRNNNYSTIIHAATRHDTESCTASIHRHMMRLSFPPPPPPTLSSAKDFAVPVLDNLVPPVSTPPPESAVNAGAAITPAGVVVADDSTAPERQLYDSAQLQQLEKRLNPADETCLELQQFTSGLLTESAASLSEHNDIDERIKLYHRHFQQQPPQHHHQQQQQQHHRLLPEHPYRQSKCDLIYTLNTSSAAAAAAVAALSGSPSKRASHCYCTTTGSTSNPKQTLLI